MFKRLLTFIIVFCVSLVAHYSFASDVEVTAMRISKSSDQLKVVFDLSKGTKYKAFLLNNPNRLVIDLDKGAWSMSRPSPNQLIDVSQGLVQNIRSGQYDSKVYRIVFELADEVKVDTTLIPPSRDSSMHRLFVDMKMLNAPLPTNGTFTSQTSVINNNANSTSSNNSIESAFNNFPLGNAAKNTYPQFDIGNKLIVAIDAGHGGKDPGAMGKKKTREKDVVLKISKLLADRVNRHPQMKAVLTRTDDYFVDLHTRTKIARNAGADLFISIHADAVARGSAKGSSVYVLSNKRASSEFAKRLADRENDSFADGALVGKDKDVKQVLLDLSKDRVLHDSLLMANDVLDKLKNIGPVHSNKTERASFAVLKSLDIPSILVETAFISNLKEEAKLLDPNFQNQLSQAIYNGIVSYAGRGAFNQVAQRGK